MDKVQQEADNLYKQHFGKLVASLLYASRDIDPETAEDIVQDAFSAALIDWRLQGIPDKQRRMVIQSLQKQGAE